MYIYIYTHTGYVYVKTKQGVALPTGDVTSVTLAEERMQLMLDMIRDVDELLGTQGHMLLGLSFFFFDVIRDVDELLGTQGHMLLGLF